MAVLTKLVDAVLFLSFLTIAIAAPLIDSQTILPLHLYPTILVDLKSWYTNEFSDFLVAEKPHFFVGLIWLELLFQWPLALLCLYGLTTSKSWYSTTCLMYGSSVLTSMVAILAEIILSKKASDVLLKLYAPFLGISVLAILRGLLSSHPGKSGAIGRRSALNRKKRA
ncbi:OLC1v1025032C3 [Oldenlandia corymbosa var. corymbosa]|uniref:OLC1v1025032C3 n=1 Tax=Oldenlandia corymbosa var. corymbosa TaxID=529605 RepID=A0AAV1C429_OLDCO|nr:OLC1v1025032C3 [Oldenlandia corymbosa var. corymbosa]